MNSDFVTIFLDGKPLSVPRHTLTDYETREALGLAPGTSAAFEGGWRVAFIDGWDFLEAQRFITVAGQVFDGPREAHVDLAVDSAEPWVTDPDSWRGESDDDTG